MILFAMGSICYPLAVSLATREVPPELQGSLQGAATWYVFSVGFKGFAFFFIFCVFLPIFFKLLLFLFHIVRWWPKIQVSVLETLAKIFAPVLASDEPWWQLETCSFRVRCIFWSHDFWFLILHSDNPALFQLIWFRWSSRRMTSQANSLAWFTWWQGCC